MRRFLKLIGRAEDSEEEIPVLEDWSDEDDEKEKVVVLVPVINHELESDIIDVYEFLFCNEINDIANEEFIVNEELIEANNKLLLEVELLESLKNLNKGPAGSALQLIKAKKLAVQFGVKLGYILGRGVIWDYADDTKDIDLEYDDEIQEGEDRDEEGLDIIYQDGNVTSRITDDYNLNGDSWLGDNNKEENTIELSIDELEGMIGDNNVDIDNDNKRVIEPKESNNYGETDDEGNIRNISWAEDDLNGLLDEENDEKKSLDNLRINNSNTDTEARFIDGSENDVDEFEYYYSDEDSEMEEEKYIDTSKKYKYYIIEWIIDEDKYGPMRHNIPLHKNHLCARAFTKAGIKVEGSFVYTPYSYGDKHTPAGRVQFTATFMPKDTDRFTSISLTKHCFVAKGFPTITWVLPQHKHKNTIVYSTLLSETAHLCAKCETLKGGQFFYKQYLKQKLEMGSHILTTRYVPSVEDSVNWRPVTMSLPLEVVGFISKLEWGKIPEVVFPNGLIKDHYPVKAMCRGEEIFGRWIYNPPLGTQLGVGTHKIECEFVPFDKVRFLGENTENVITVIKGIPEIIWETPPMIYEGLLQAIVLNASCTLGEDSGIFIYTPPENTKMKIGKIDLIVEFIPHDNLQYESVIVKKPISVKPRARTLLIWPRPEPIVYPGPLMEEHLCAEVSGRGVVGRFIYNPPVGTILDVGINVLFVQFISETSGRDDSYTSTEIEIKRGDPILFWPDLIPLLEGNKLTIAQLQCTCTNLKDGIFTYDPPMGTIPECGEQLLHVLYTPEGKNYLNYNTAKCSAKIWIRAKVKTISRLKWAKPDDIIYPTPLSGTQLNATCDSPGEFKYKPSWDCNLPVGTHTLIAYFTPKLANFLPANIEVEITVHPSKPELAWSPMPLSYGKKISVGMQLNAECITKGVLGNFKYTPENGTLVDSGQVILHCLFTPHDENYLPVEMTTSVQIGRGYPKLIWDIPPTLAYVIYPAFITKEDYLNVYCSRPKLCKGIYKYSHKDGDEFKMGVNTITCRFYPDDIINLYSMDITTEVTVSKGIPQLFWRDLPPKIVFGKALDKDMCNAFGEVDGTVEYDPPIGTYLTVGDWDIIGTFTPSDEFFERYGTATITRSIMVTPATLKLEWPLSKGYTIPYGKPISTIELCARLHRTKNTEFHLNFVKEIMAKTPEGIFKYDPPVGKCFDGGENHCLTAYLNIPSEFKDNYTRATIRASLSVSKLSPTITWECPIKEITYGMRITGAMLNATCDYEGGSYKYDPPIGTILGPGRRTIYVEYTPAADMMSNLSGGQGKTVIEVLRAAPNIVWDPPKEIYLGTKLSFAILKARIDPTPLDEEMKAAGIVNEGLFKIEKFDGSWNLESNGHDCLGAALGAKGDYTLTLQLCPNGKGAFFYQRSAILTHVIKAVSKS